MLSSPAPPFFSGDGPVTEHLRRPRLRMLAQMGAPSVFDIAEKIFFCRNIADNLFSHAFANPLLRGIIIALMI